MSIIKWSPLLNDMPLIHRGFGRNLFDWPLSELGDINYFPAVDVYEKDNNVIVETELAGVDPEKVDISVEDDILIVEGKSEKKQEVEEKGYYRKEIKRGSFYRNIPLPTRVIGEEASAMVENGILKVSIPKAKEAKAKKIKIKMKK